MNPNTSAKSASSVDFPVQVLVATCGAWWLRHTAKAFQERAALAGLWISDKNTIGIEDRAYRRCWPFHVAMLPFYLLTPQIWIERAFHALLPLWRLWIRRQTLPQCNVVQAILGFGTELFDKADGLGALKVADCPNSHPVSAYGFWQRECDLWCPGERVPVPAWFFGRQVRELEHHCAVQVLQGIHGL
jgi:hypothetical protein